MKEGLMESDNLNQLLNVETGANDKSLYINNLDTDKLDLLKKDFPQFDELGRNVKKNLTWVFAITRFPIDHHNEKGSLIQIDGIGDQMFLSIFSKFGLIAFIIVSILIFYQFSTGLAIFLWILSYLLFQAIQYFGNSMRAILKNNKGLAPSLKELFTQRVKTLHELYVKSQEGLKFNVKNSIDITGTVDLTKPPPFYFEMKDKGNILEGFVKIKNNDSNLNNIVSIHLGYEKTYIIDKESELFFEKYVNRALDWKICNDKFYSTYIFLRKFDLKAYLSIIFLVFEFYLHFSKRDEYSIIQRKIISFNKDLNTEEILEKTKPFRPRLINIDNEVIEFTPEDIYQKADEKEYEKFMNDYEDIFETKPKLYESLGIKEGMELFNKDFDYINVRAQVCEKYTIAIIVSFIASIKEHTFVWVGNTSKRTVFPIGKVDVSCNKPSYVEEGLDGMKIIHIKYATYPFEVKLLNDFKTFLKYEETQTVFGPSSHYPSRGAYY